MQSRFGVIYYREVYGDEVYECGFARNCKEMILTAFPGTPREVFEREDIKDMMDQVDNVTGVLYAMDARPGEPLLMHSTLEGLKKEYSEWLGSATLSEVCSQTS